MPFPEKNSYDSYVDPSIIGGVVAKVAERLLMVVLNESRSLKK